MYIENVAKEKIIFWFDKNVFFLSSKSSIIFADLVGVPIWNGIELAWRQITES